MSPWMTTILSALDFAITQAKALGLDPPGVDEIERIKAEVDKRIGQVLPLAIVGVATAAVGVAAKTDAAIESLGKSPTCPKCSAVARQHVEKQIDGPGTVRLTCDTPGCGWSLP